MGIVRGLVGGLLVIGSACTVGSSHPSDAGSAEPEPESFCPPGQHDGGDGVCVAIGECRSSFVLEDTGACAGFRLRAPMNEPRADHTITPLLDGRVLVIGGFGDDRIPHASAELYDPTSDSWTFAAAPAYARASHTATLLEDGRVLVIGGWFNDGGEEVLANGAEIYDPALNLFVSGGDPGPRAGHLAVRLRDGRVFAAGGNGTHDSIYTPATREWTSTPPAPSLHLYGAAALLLDGLVLVVGGRHGGVSVGTTSIFDPEQRTWSEAMPLPHPRYHFSAVALGESVLVNGGWGGGQTTFLYDVPLARWRELASSRFNHWDDSPIPLGNDRYLGVGGGPTGRSEVYLAEEDRWIQTASAAEAHNAGAAAVLADGTVLVSGGGSAAGQSITNTVEQFRRAERR